MAEEDYIGYNMSPEISIIMSVYNSQKFLVESIESVINQTYRNFEFLIVDDASTDNSNTILRTYRGLDPRIQLWENTSNIGLTKNLNFLISKCKGKFIARMDADDVCMDNRLQKQIDLFLKLGDEVVLIGSNAEVIDSYGVPIGLRRMPRKANDISRLVKYYNTINHPTVMIRHEVLRAFRYNEKFRTSQDWDLWMRLTIAGHKCYNIQENLVQYRANSTYFRRKRFSYRMNEIVIKYYNVNLFKGPHDFIISILYTLMLAILPPRVQLMLKKLDPRQ